MSAAPARKTHQDGEEIGLPLVDVRTNFDTQSRVELHQPTVNEYADLMQAGTVFPPLTVFYDGRNYILADGFHRLHAARKLKLAEIQVKVRNGNRLAAVLYAAGANRDHGLRRSNADKRKSVASILLEKFWADKSDHWVAEQAGVTHQFVGKLRREFEEKGAIAKSPLATVASGKTGKDGRTINTTNIGGKGGRKPKAPLPEETPPVRPDPKPEPIIEHKQPFKQVLFPSDPGPNFDDLRLLVMDKAKVEAHRAALAEMLRNLAAHVEALPCAS